MAELKPCKKCYFCEKDKLVIVRAGLVDKFFALCNSCGAQGPIKDTEFEAVEAWNKDGFYSKP